MRQNMWTSWMRLAVISARLSRSEAWQTPTLSLRPVPDLLPACRSPHRSPDWSNRPWTPRPSGPRCGPEIGQTPNDRAPRHEDEPIATQEWWWVVTMRSTACKEEMKTWGMVGQTDIHGCLDNVNTHGHDGPVKTRHTQTTGPFFNTCMCLYETTHLQLWKYIKRSWQKHEDDFLINKTDGQYKYVTRLHSHF